MSRLARGFSEVLAPLFKRLAPLRTSVRSTVTRGVAQLDAAERTRAPLVTGDRFHLTAAPTPFAGDDVAETAFARYVDWQIEQGCRGLVVGGETGEAPALSWTERTRLIKIAVDAASGRAAVIAATGTNCTRESIALTEAAQRAGAEAAILVAPYYNKPGQRGLLQHFREIARAVDLPLIIEVDPSRTAIDIAHETFLELAKLPNVVAVAHADGGLGRMRRNTPLGLRRIAHVSEVDDDFVAFQIAGGDGSISKIANVVPALWRALCRDAEARRWDRAMAIQTALGPLISAASMEPGPAPIKYALSLLHPWFSAQMRLPLTPVASETGAAIREALARL
jgi:4-hydroxy-tetrahydrodipicolinate synthase